MSGLLSLSRRIDHATRWLGRGVSWLILAAVLVSAGNAVIRKVFDTSSNAWLELQWYLFGTAFMLAIAWALQTNEHVRIDVVSARLSKRARDWIDLVCHFLFLLPFVILMIWLSVPFFLRSFESGERSMNAGGLILWPAKIMVPLGFILLLAQAISEIIKRIAVIRGEIPDPYVKSDEDLPPAVREMEDRETAARAPGPSGKDRPHA